MELWAIANDDPDKLRDYAEGEGFDFPLLLDADGAVIEAWGLLNTLDHRGRRIPHPAMVMVDVDGLVRYIQVETNYRLRPSAEEVIAAVEQALE